MVALGIFAFILGLAASDPVAATPAPAAAVDAGPSPQRVFGLIRARFRSHTVPPFESYTLIRKTYALDGNVEHNNSYGRRVWVRNSDGAALTRLMIDDRERGPLAFDRPAFNEARDPGPPTADLFDSAPAAASPVDASNYRVDSLQIEGDQVHLHLTPVRDAEHNRLREVFADRTTYDVRKLIAADKLFVDRGPTYPVKMTITMGVVQSIPVVSEIRGVVGGNYNQDSGIIDFTFTDIKFPASLPDWYFDPRSYRQHQGDGPS